MAGRVQRLVVGFIALVALQAAPHAVAQCPWHRQVKELQASCICALNLGQELSVQCDMVDFQLLLNALDAYARDVSIELLYINNSSVGVLGEDVFRRLRLKNVQLSGCRIRSIAKGAFRSQEATLKNLNLQDNELTEVPVESLYNFQNLTLLDLSRNRIESVPGGAFATLKSLGTLKLSDNNVTFAPDAFSGLQDSLKNLNLKGTRQKRIPESIAGLRTLAFLDLAQNGLRELPGPGGTRALHGLHSLSALNLERNLIQTVSDDAFQGVSQTLSSLSLLNNLLTDFPTGAINALHELRVLDIGFNLLTELPSTAFEGTPSLTLLAVDGNPLSTVPERVVGHLNTTLRGLSLGGRFLVCDCRLRWLAEWVARGDLQVTSRERNPQFCSAPPHFRDRSFYSIQPQELTCLDTSLEEDKNDNEPVLIPVTTTTSTTSTTTTTTTTTTTPAPTTTTTTTPKPPPPPPPTTTTTTTTTTPRPTTTSTTTTTPVPSTTTTTSTTSPAPIRHFSKSRTTTSTTTPEPRRGSGLVRSTSAPSWRTTQRPTLLLPGFPQPTKGDGDEEVKVRTAYRQDNSIIIQWDSQTSNILGFRVVYRLFGDKTFKQGPPLESSEREFKIKNVPSQECIVVCVVSLEEVNVTPESVANRQCREVRTVGSATSNMDKITIAASAAICGTVVVAVIIFVAASRRRTRKLHTLQQQQADQVMGGKGVCCLGPGPTPTPSPPAPLSSLATLSAFTNHKDWDQVSVYSNRSIARPPRMYHVERQGSLAGDDIRSHVHSHAHSAHYGGIGPGMGAGIGPGIGNKSKARSMADGQSQHSFSNQSGRYLPANSFGLVCSPQELRHSRQSLAVSERMSRVSCAASHHSSAAVSRRQRPRSRSRSRTRDPQIAPLMVAKRPGSLTSPGSRYSVAGSTHTLNYCDTSDNWTDHDMDIYMARNPTTRTGLVPL